MTAGAGRSVGYTAFNMTLSVTQGDNEEEYIYDSEHSRVELYDYQGESANVLYYLNDPASGAMSEISWVDYTWHDYLQVDGKLIAVSELKEPYRETILDLATSILRIAGLCLPLINRSVRTAQYCGNSFK